MEGYPIGPALPVKHENDLEDIKESENIDTGFRRSTRNYRIREDENLEVIEELRLNKLEYYRREIDIS